jgi:deoxyadenosine/deoxycytidine kinase
LSVNFPYNFIAIEGNIGAGKTTLCNMIAEDFGGRLVLERFAENPFLPFFYENPERYAFTVELFFMTERHKQLQEELAQQSLFEEFIVADYFFLKTLLFAKNNLSTEEYRLFQRLFHLLNASFPKPELLVYLHRPVSSLLQNIAKRGRTYEQDISAEYLLRIQDTYFEFFRTEQSVPILILEIEDIDFKNNPEYYRQLIALLQEQYPTGIQRIELR